MAAKKQDPRVSAAYKKQRLRVLARDGWTCFYCGQDATQVDHIVPVSKGGDPIDMDNMVASCAKDNNLKGSRSQAVFLKVTSTRHYPREVLSPRAVTTAVTQSGPCFGQPAQGETG